MFVEMTVVIVPVGSEIKLLGTASEVFNSFSDSQYLQCLFAVDTGCRLEVALQGSRADVMLFGERVNGNIKIVVL